MKKLVIWCNGQDGDERRFGIDIEDEDGSFQLVGKCKSENEALNRAKKILFRLWVKIGKIQDRRKATK